MLDRKVVGAVASSRVAPALRRHVAAVPFAVEGGTGIAPRLLGQKLSGEFCAGTGNEHATGAKCVTTAGPRRQ